MGIQQNLADAMRIIKERRNISLVDFSEELGISCSTLQEYFHGQGNPTILMVEHIASKLNLDPIALMSGVLEPNQIDVLLLFLESVQKVSYLPQYKKRQFVRLLRQMIELWEETEIKNYELEAGTQIETIDP